METQNKLYVESLKKAITRRVILAGASGLILLVTAWIIELSSQGLQFSLSGISAAHTGNPSLWILDFLPLAFIYIIWIQERKHFEKVAFLEEEIQQSREDINKNALFAKQIGEGDYHAPFQISDEDDILGKSLLVMRDNLLANNRKEADQSWISKGKEEVSHILRLFNNLEELSYEVLIKLIKYIEIIQGALYLYDDETQTLTNLATYAYNRKKYQTQEFRIGQGLIGQCAYEQHIHLPNRDTQRLRHHNLRHPGR
jgi:hypothetical protein